MHRVVTLAGEVNGYRIYDNRNVMDRFFFVQQVRTVDSLADAAAVVQSPDFRPAEETVVEAPGEAFDVGAEAAARVRVVSYGATAIRLETESSQNQFLVAADSYYPGWEASVDGIAARIYPTDVAFRGVRVPAGKHTIEFRFVPRTLYWSMAISAAALAGLAILCVV